MKRLVVGTNWIGDAVMSLPFLRAIRAAHPGDSLSVFAPRGPASIYRASGSADEVLVRSFFLRDAAVLASRKVRRGLAASRTRSGRLSMRRASRAPRRIGYATDGRTALLTDPMSAPEGAGHQLRDYDALLSAHGIPPDPDPPRLPLPEEARRLADRALRAAGLTHAVDRLVLLVARKRPGPDEALACGAIRGPRRPARPAAVYVRDRRRARTRRPSASPSRAPRRRRFPSSDPTWIPSASPRCWSAGACSSRTTRARCTWPRPSARRSWPSSGRRIRAARLPRARPPPCSTATSSAPPVSGRSARTGTSA